MRMKKFNKKNGFTLAEVLCALAIVGIILALVLPSMTPSKKAVKYLYMNAYNSLSKAYYNGLNDGYDPFAEVEIDDIVPVHSDTQDSGAELLCRGLTTYINTMDNEKTSDHDYSASCSSSKLTSQLANNFSDDKVQFVATNGMKFYISKRLGSATDFYFYLVFVDVNGNKGPNTVEYTYKRGKSADDYDTSNPNDLKRMAEDEIEPDIYAFALLSTGRICPIGIPEYDTDVMTARFAYYDSDGEPLYTHKSLAYYQAKGAAWGFYNENGPDALSDFNIDEPYTMNDIIRDKIDSNSKIVADFPDLNTLEPVATAVEEPYSCSDEDIESCYIFLDAYRQY